MNFLTCGKQIYQFQAVPVRQQYKRYIRLECNYILINYQAFNVRVEVLHEPEGEQELFQVGGYDRSHQNI